MPDPTIPRHDARRPRTVTSGWFVDYGDRVVLRDRWGNTWAEESVSIVQGGFGYKEDGAQKLPRPYTYDANGGVVVEGDVVVIDFLDGNPKTPLVLGGVRSAKDAGFLSRGYQDEDAPYNRMAARLRALDTSGGVVGEARLEVHASGDEGGVKLSATAKLELLVASDLDSEASPIRVTIADGIVTVEGGGLTEPVLKATTFQADLAASLTEVSAALGALGLPAVNTGTLSTNAGLGSYSASKLEAE